MDDTSSVTFPPRPLDRRAFLSTIGIASAALASGCHSSLTGVSANYNGAEHLTSRVAPPTQSVATGLQPLGLGGEASSRDGKLFVPTSYSPSQPLPLVVLLHGAGGSAANWFGSYAARAEAARYLVLAPDSRFTTWDASLGTPFQIDLPFLDLALRETFKRCAVDASRIALAGFSDGASYALSVGLANGDLFNRVIAYSPGYFLDSTRRGKPKLFFSHGTADLVLPIDRASRTLVKRFRNEGYGVESVEFEGGHEVPSSISDQAFAWLGTSWG
jgi:phospholipase/carboxylesterase